MFLNNSLKIMPYAVAETGAHGVILPKSDKVLFESDIDSKIQKIHSHIRHLSNAKAHRKTHGGKGFRGKQISLQDQINSSKNELALLILAKEKIAELDRAKQLALLIRNLADSALGFNMSISKSYTRFRGMARL